MSVPRDRVKMEECVRIKSIATVATAVAQVGRDIPACHRLSIHYIITYLVMSECCYCNTLVNIFHTVKSVFLNNIYDKRLITCVCDSKYLKHTLLIEDR